MRWSGGGYRVSDADESFKLLVRARPRTTRPRSTAGPFEASHSPVTPSRQSSNAATPPSESRPRDRGRYDPAPRHRGPAPKPQLSTDLWSFPMSRNRGRIWATVFAVPTIALLCSTTASAVPGCTGMCAGTIVNAPSYEEYEVIGTGTGVDDAITTAYCDAGDSLVAGGHEMTDVDATRRSPSARPTRTAPRPGGGSPPTCQTAATTSGPRSFVSTTTIRTTDEADADAALAAANSRSMPRSQLAPGHRRLLGPGRQDGVPPISSMWTYLRRPIERRRPRPYKQSSADLLSAPFRRQWIAWVVALRRRSWRLEAFAWLSGAR